MEEFFKVAENKSDAKPSITDQTSSKDTGSVKTKQECKRKKQNDRA